MIASLIGPRAFVATVSAAAIRIPAQPAGLQALVDGHPVRLCFELLFYMLSLGLGLGGMVNGVNGTSATRPSSLRDRWHRAA